MKSTSFRFSSPLLFVLLFIGVAIAELQDASNDVACTYTLNVKTGNVNNAGTDSRISVVLGDESHTWMIPDLASNGVMPGGYDYFEKGRLDSFAVKGTCMPRPVCRIIVTSDNSGNKPGWFVEYVDVIMTEPNRPRRRNIFYINQWLATDSAPFQLSTRRENCGVSAGEVLLDHSKVQTS